MVFYFFLFLYLCLPSCSFSECVWYVLKMVFLLRFLRFCSCVEAQFPTCMGCLADLEPFYKESTAVYSTLATCPRMRDLYKNAETVAQLEPIWEEQCSRCGTNGWLTRIIVQENPCAFVIRAMLVSIAQLNDIRIIARVKSL
ncbi:hypothetical protein QOT17_009063 [Balamuthia mandrillaris]